jgi:MraZ protein
MSRPKLVGQYTNKIDAKGRTFLPKRLLRQVIARWGDEPRLFLTFMGFEPCLVLVERDEWIAKRQKFSALDWMDEDAARLRRLASLGDNIRMDDQGRLAVPAFLRGLVGIEDQITFVGCEDYIELWKPENVQNALGDLMAEASELIKRVQDRSAAAGAIREDGEHPDA